MLSRLCETLVWVQMVRLSLVEVLYEPGLCLELFLSQFLLVAVVCLIARKVRHLDFENFVMACPAQSMLFVFGTL